MAFGQTDPLERADVAAAEDGRTPLNTCGKIFIGKHTLFVVLVLLGAAMVCVAGGTETVAVPKLDVESAAADCHDAAISGDGRFVVFVSRADNLVPNDGNGAFDVFVRDRALGKTILVSVNGVGTRSGNGPSLAASISVDGRFVAFESSASDLVANDTNNGVDIFVRDLLERTTALVSVSRDGVSPGIVGSSGPVMTPDGRFVLFESRASNLALNDLNNAADLFVRDLAAGTTTVVTRDRFGTFSAMGGEQVFSDTARISDDGRWIAFSSSATNLVGNDNNLRRDVFVRDLLNRTNFLASVNTNRVAGNNNSGWPAMSADGRYVAFQSLASDLVPNDKNSTNDVFVRDLVLGTTTLVSANRLGNSSGTGSSFSPMINADGRYVAFQSLADDLASGDESSLWTPKFDVFVRDLQTGNTIMASEHSALTVLDSAYYTNWTRTASERSALPVSLSRDGRFVVFQSEGYDETTTVPNGGQVGSTTVSFLLGTSVFDQTTGARTRVSSAVFPALSEDGRIVAFQAAARDQLTNESSAVVNIFALDLGDGSMELISRRDSILDSLTGRAMSQLTPASISANGRFVAYESFAANLAANDTNGTSDVFVRDLITGSNEWVSASYYIDLSSPGGTSDSNVLVSLSPSRLPALSGDGRRVAFEAVLRTARTGNVLTPPLTNGLNNQFTLCVYDRIERTNQFVATVSATNKPGPPATPVWNADGRYLAFQSSWPDPAIPNSAIGQIYSRDLTLGTNVLVSLSQVGGAGGSKPSWNPVMSADGTRVLFLSAATDLVTNVVSGTNLFLWDATTGSNTLVSVSTSGGSLGRVSQPTLSAGGRFASFLNRTNLYFCDLTLSTLSLIVSNASTAALSADGRFVAFESADILAGNDTNSVSDVFLYDSASNAVILASVNLEGTASGNGRSASPLISSDGRYVIFTSQASDLVANDTNGFTDVFLRDLAAGTTMLLSMNFGGTGTGSKLSANPVLSAEGKVVLFESYSPDLTVGDFNEAKDIFVFRLSAGDSDGDGMADDWETAYFGDLSRNGNGDFDSDGQSDLAEFRAGANPTDNNSIFRAFTLSSPNRPNAVMVLWNAVPGRTYRVQYKDGIEDPDWADLQGDVVATGATGARLDNTTETVAKRFYRVMAVP